MNQNSPKSHQKRGSELESLLHSEHIVQIEKLVVGGDGLARLQHQGKSLVVFVSGAAPNEKVKIKIIAAEKNHLNGEVVEIVEASASRRPAPCEYFSKCGGCTWQHIYEDEQIRQKEQILKDLFKKFIPDAVFELAPSVVSPNNLHYRNRIQLKQLGAQLGYFQKRSHQIVDIEHCPIAEKEISQQISKIKAGLRPSPEIKKFELRINHLKQFEFYPIGEDGEGLSFSQVNTPVNEQLIAAVLKLVESRQPGFLTELYAGAGNFSFPLLQALPELRIESAELNSKLTTFAVKKLTEQKLQKRLFAFTADCESFVERRTLSDEFILLDPPRAGCSEQVMKRLISAGSSDILYISCHPVFLARDLAKIMIPDKLGRTYRIKHLQIFDMFPQTDHFETLVLLSKS